MIKKDSRLIFKIQIQNNFFRFKIAFVNSLGHQKLLSLSYYLNLDAVLFFLFCNPIYPPDKRRGRSECQRISQSRDNDVTRGCRLGCPKPADRFRSVSLNWAIHRRPHVRASVPPPSSPPLPTIPLPFPLSGRRTGGTGECVSLGSK